MTRSMLQIKREENKVNIWKKTRKETEEGIMLKRLMVALVIGIIAIAAIAAVAYAESEPQVGFVTSETLLRNGDEVVSKLSQGDLVVIVGEGESTFSVIRQSSWEDGVREAEGSVDRTTIKVGKRQRVSLLVQSKLWSVPGYFDVSLGEFSKDESFVLINLVQTWDPETNEYVDWYCVLLEKGVAFITKETVSDPFISDSDADFYASVEGGKAKKASKTEKVEEAVPTEPETEEEELFEPDLTGDEQTSEPENNTVPGANYKVTGKKPVAVSATADDRNVIGYLNVGDQVKVIEWGDKYSKIEYAYNGITLEVYVASKNIKEI